MSALKCLKSVAAIALIGSASATALAAPAAPARTFHTFVISEVYSTVDGSVQFIELREGSGLNGQHQLAAHTITASNADFSQQRVFTFPTALPNNLTAGKRVLIATAGFGALPGGRTPDYIIPAGFLFPSGSVNFADLGGGAEVSYTALPTDGQQSLVFPPLVGGALATNSPANYLNSTNPGAVNIPSGSCCIGAACTQTTAGTCTGTFAAASPCSPTPCGGGATGACCNGTACTVVIQAACSGTYRGDGMPCGTSGNPVACCPANFNGAAGVSVQDIFDFLSAYFDGNAAADFNGAGGVTVQDIFDFLSAYFAGCP